MVIRVLRQNGGDMRVSARLLVPGVLIIVLFQSFHTNPVIALPASVTSDNYTSIQRINLPPVAPASYPPVTHLTAVIKKDIMQGYNRTSLVRLSFDDCANQARLNNLLAMLSRYKVQAIFFFTGQCMRENPGYRSQLIRSGQLLGNHSSTHPDYAKLSDSKVTSQLRNGLVPTTVPHLARAPYGSQALTVRFYNLAAKLGMKTAFWTCDTRDWAGYSAARIIGRVLYGESGRNGTAPVQAGGMVLMHGFGKNTLAALPGIIKGIRSKHLALFALQS